jgi:hypothetical protein
MKKPVSPAAHGVMDYVLSGIEIAATPFLRLNPTATRTYQALGAGYTIVNALTNSPVGLKKLIPMRTHQKGDLGMLGAMALLSFAPFLRRDKKAMIFHLSVLGLIALQYALTDFNRAEK